MAKKLIAELESVWLCSRRLGLIFISMSVGLQGPNIPWGAIFLNENGLRVSTVHDDKYDTETTNEIYWRAATKKNFLDSFFRNKWCLVQVNDRSSSLPEGEVYFSRSSRVCELLVKKQIETFSLGDKEQLNADELGILEFVKQVGLGDFNAGENNVAAFLLNASNNECVSLKYGTEAEIIEIIENIEIPDVIPWIPFSTKNLEYSANCDRWIMLDFTAIAPAPAGYWKYRKSQRIGNLLLEKGIDCYLIQGDLAGENTADAFRYLRDELLPTLPKLEPSRPLIGAFYNFKQSSETHFSNEEELLSILSQIESDDIDIVPWITPSVDDLENTVAHGRWLLLLNEEQLEHCKGTGENDFRRSRAVRELLINLGIDCYRVGGVFSTAATEDFVRRQNELAQALNATDESTAGRLINFKQNEVVSLAKGTEAEFIRVLKEIREQKD